MEDGVLRLAWFGPQGTQQKEGFTTCGAVILLEKMSIIMEALLQAD